MFPPATDELLGGARARSGLSDFGDPRFANGLRTLIGCFGAERSIRFIGRRFIMAMLINSLENRLLVREAQRLQPGIAEERIRRPLFIVGLNRTGTTFLHNLLALAGDARAPRAWEVMQPAPPCATGGPEERRRVRRSARALWFLGKVAPGLRRAHPIGASDHEECYPLVNNTFTSPAFSLHYGLPAYSAWLRLLDAETERWVYREYRGQLQVLQVGRSAKRWILKSAVHLYFLRALFAEFPDACVVQTHRDPLQMLPSLCSMVSGFRRMVYSRVPEETLGRELLDKSREALERGRKAREEPSAGRVLDIEFEKLVADPVGQVRYVHEFFDLGWDALLERRIRSRLAAGLVGPTPGHRYAMGRFGLDEDMILSHLPHVRPGGGPA